MRKIFLFAITLFAFSGTFASEQFDGDVNNPKNSEPRGYFIKRPGLNIPTAIYNAPTTELTVKMPAITSGKVEIYRNGVKVVDAAATAGASLSYVLRNYGKGNYAVIVRQGNTIVYSSNTNVK